MSGAGISHGARWGTDYQPREVKCKFHKTIYTVPWFNNLRKQDSGTWDISEKADGKNAVEAKLNAGRFGEAE